MPYNQNKQTRKKTKPCLKQLEWGWGALQSQFLGGCVSFICRWMGNWTALCTMERKASMCSKDKVDTVLAKASLFGQFQRNRSGSEISFSLLSLQEEWAPSCTEHRFAWWKYEALLKPFKIAAFFIFFFLPPPVCVCWFEENKKQKQKFNSWTSQLDFCFSCE